MTNFNPKKILAATMFIEGEIAEPEHNKQWKKGFDQFSYSIAWGDKSVTFIPLVGISGAGAAPAAVFEVAMDC